MTTTKTYTSAGAMKRGIRKMSARGWKVVSTAVDSRGYGCGKTVLYGCLFLPLALLGKKPNRYLVTFERVSSV